MKISIDFKDPEIQETLYRAIDAKIAEIVATQVDAAVTRIVEIKLDRLTEKRIDELTTKAVNSLVESYFTKSWNSTSKFEDILAKEARACIKAAFKS